MKKKGVIADCGCMHISGRSAVLHRKGDGWKRNSF